VEIFEKDGVKHQGLFTFADSPKHLGLYHKFGFCSRFLTTLMEKEVRIDQKIEHGLEHFSSYDESEKKEAIRLTRELTDGLFSGLDLSGEIRIVDQQKLGDTLMLFEDSSLIAFAICQTGPDTEAGSNRLYVKFGATKIGKNSNRIFDSLITACETFAADRGASVVDAGINLSHDKAFDIMLKRGFRISFIGVAMQRPNEPAFLRNETFMMEDWR